MDAAHAGSRRTVALIVGVAILATAIVAGVTIAVSRSTPSSEPVSNSNSISAGTNLDYYRSMMRGMYGSGMMGGSYGWMMGTGGYQWMMGGTQAPAWMMGSTLPGFMMGTSGDPGQVMGHFWAGAPGPRVSAAEAARLAAATPAGATVDPAANRVTFTTDNVRFAVVASPTTSDEHFAIAGLTDPTVVVPAGASVSIQLINADANSAHGLVVTSAFTPPPAMPMMGATPAFSGAALWFLGASTSAGMHDGSVTFTAERSGTYAYLCPVPLHAQRGMAGRIVVGLGS